MVLALNSIIWASSRAGDAKITARGNCLNQVSKLFRAPAIALRCLSQHVYVCMYVWRQGGCFLLVLFARLCFKSIRSSLSCSSLCNRFLLFRFFSDSFHSTSHDLINHFLSGFLPPPSLSFLSLAFSEAFLFSFSVSINHFPSFLSFSPLTIASFTLISLLPVSYLLIVPYLSRLLNSVPYIYFFLSLFAANPNHHSLPISLHSFHFPPFPSLSSL